MSIDAGAHVAVIGAGPAGLMAAQVLRDGGARVTVFERMPSAGRKFLLAGRGGLNLTHSEPLDKFLARYRGARASLEPAIRAFSPQDLRAWSDALGQETFVGSSGRVFPTAMKASPLLRAWLRRLDASGVRFRLRHRWTGWDDGGALLFETPQGRMSMKADATVLALGGASWPHLGADGSFADVLSAGGISVAPLRAGKAGFHGGWSERFRAQFEGHPLKGIALSFGDEIVRGEAVITATGIEGGAVYALSSPLREAILRDGSVTLHIALRPDLDEVALTQRLAAPRGKQSFSNMLRKALKLSPVAIGLLREAALVSGADLATLPPAELAAFINALPLTLTGIRPIARAISTAGGVAFDEIDSHFMLKKMPGVFVAGEMIDWDAPTGGYLLQASFATGAAAARGALHYLRERA